MQLKVYATRQSISSPISDDYGARVDTAETIKKWYTNHANDSNYIPSTFYVFPVLAMVFIFLAVYYYNEFKENSRMYEIKRTLSSNDCYGKRKVMYELQNEVVVSLMFIVHVIILSSFAVAYTLDIDKHLNKHVKNYFRIHNLSRNLEYSSSLAITTLSLDLFVVLILQIIVVVLVIIKSRKEWDDIGKLCLCTWRYCAYSVVFPYCLIVNHSNYIIIAFIHDVYHATGVAIIYGVVISALFGVLMQISYWFDKCKFKEITDIELQNFSRQPFNSGDHNITRYTLIGILVFKIIAGLFLVGCLLFDILLYYLLPTNDFDNATNHLMTLYQTTASFFTAIAVYFFLQNRSRSPIGILTQAEYKNSIMEKHRSNKWSTFTDDRRDLEMAKDILKVLSAIKTHCETSARESPRDNDPSADLPTET